MHVADIMRQIPVQWVPERPPNPIFLPDLRYTHTQSIYEVDGREIGEQLRPFLVRSPDRKPPISESTKDVNRVEAPRKAALARILEGSAWDEDDKPKPVLTPIPTKVDGPRAPLVLTQHCDAPLGITDSPHSTNWLRLVANGIAHCFNGMGPLDEVYRELMQAMALASYPARTEDSFSYARDVENSARASQSIRPLWYEFMDTAINVAQSAMALPTPPVLLVLFTDHHMEPGLKETLQKQLAKRSHPRLLVLLSGSMV